MMDISDARFCCKLFKGPVELSLNKENNIDIYFHRPYNGMKAITVTKNTSMEVLIESIKMMNASTNKDRELAIKEPFDKEMLQEEIAYLISSNDFSISETDLEYIVSFHLSTDISRIISKQASILDVSTLVKSLL